MSKLLEVSNLTGCISSGKLFKSKNIFPFAFLICSDKLLSFWDNASSFMVSIFPEDESESLFTLFKLFEKIVLISEIRNIFS